LIYSDILKLRGQLSFTLNCHWALLYFLHNNQYYRCLFYHRIGPVKSLLISWIRPGDRYFAISQTTKIGGGFWLAHPYATIINADSVGENFRIIHCTTIGATAKGRPTIGNNVALGANVTIIGNISIGNNVSIGAGSVVTKSIPDNCVVVGNPARIVKKDGKKVSMSL
jgi:serine acetyltransferase